jgi:hypothetical protein
LNFFKILFFCCFNIKHWLDAFMVSDGLQIPSFLSVFWRVIPAFEFSTHVTILQRMEDVFWTNKKYLPNPQTVWKIIFQFPLFACFVELQKKLSLYLLILMEFEGFVFLLGYLSGRVTWNEVIFKGEIIYLVHFIDGTLEDDPSMQ